MRELVKTVKVDFAQGLRDGLVRANQARASAPLAVGDVVTAVDPEDELTFSGTVERLDADGRFAYLRMDWEDAPGELETGFSILDVGWSGLSRIFNVDAFDTKSRMFGNEAPISGICRDVGPDDESVSFEARESALVGSIVVGFGWAGGDPREEPEDRPLHRVMLAR